jgi:glycolate oxidase
MADTDMMNPTLRDKVKETLVVALGERKVLWSPSDLLPYRTDCYRLRPEEERNRFPDLVVLPESTPEVQAIVRVAAEHMIPLLPKGGASNRTGMLVPIHGGIVIDTIRMNRVLEVSPPNLSVTVQPGITPETGKVTGCPRL